MPSTVSNLDAQISPTVSFPKYNNYIQDKENFDSYSKVMIPLHILGIDNIKPGM